MISKKIVGVGVFHLLLPTLLLLSCSPKANPPTPIPQKLTPSSSTSPILQDSEDAGVFTTGRDIDFDDFILRVEKPMREESITYISIALTTVNPQTVDIATLFAVQDTQGIYYKPIQKNPKSTLWGTITTKPNEKLTGTVAFSIPSSAQLINLTFYYPELKDIGIEVEL